MVRFTFSLLETRCRQAFGTRIIEKIRFSCFRAYLRAGCSHCLRRGVWFGSEGKALSLASLGACIADVGFSVVLVSPLPSRRRAKMLAVRGTHCTRIGFLSRCTLETFRSYHVLVCMGYVCTRLLRKGHVFQRISVSQLRMEFHNVRK